MALLENKQTAVEWFAIEALKLHLNAATKTLPIPVFEIAYSQIIEQAKAMEKEQNIEFANKVLYNAECSFSGIAYLEKDINELYNETYNKQ